MIGFFAQGASLGLTAGSSPGPLQTFLIQSALRYGWRRALICILSPLISDIPFILLTAFVLQEFPPQVIQIVQIGGGLFMFYLAWLTVKGLRAGVMIGANADAPTPPQNDYKPGGLLMRTVLINWTSPGPYIFWGTVNGPLLAEALGLSLWHGAAFLVGFYGVFFVLLAGWIIIFDRMRAINPRVTNLLLWLTVIILLVFGVSLLLRGVGL